MKISKRILGVALALIMIFNVFAVGTFAAFPDDTLVQLGVRADKAVYAPGDTITLTLSAKAHEELGTFMIGGTYELAYDNTAIAPFSTTDDTPAGHKVTAIAPGYDEGISGVQLPGNASEPSDMYNWNETIGYIICDDGTVFDGTAGVDLFTVQLKVKDNAPDGTYTIGYNPYGYEMYNGYINDGMGLGGLYGTSATDYGFSVPNMYEYGTCQITVSSGPSVEIAHKGTQSKWKLGDAKPYAENYLFGFVGSFTGITPETEVQNVGGKNRDIVTNIESITATATINGVTKTANVETIWKNTDGSYGFRAQFAGFLPTDTFSASCVFTIVAGGKPYTSAASAETTINAIYTTSVGNGLPALVTL